MKKSIIALGIFIFILIIIGYKEIRGDPEQCLTCHSDKKVVGEMFYVDSEKFKNSTHSMLDCTVCHKDIVMSGEMHSEAEKRYGGWSRLEDDLNYQTKASSFETCVQCHSNRKDFGASVHNTLKNMRASPQFEKKCEACHLSCTTCHWKSEIEFITLTEWALDWTANVESHSFVSTTSFDDKNDLCAACHSGSYMGYEYDPSVGGIKVYAFPQAQELSESVHRDLECTDCHTDLHEMKHEVTPQGTRLGGIECATCHEKMAKIVAQGTHKNVSCVACHDTRLPIWEDVMIEEYVPYVVREEEKVSYLSHDVSKGGRLCVDCHGFSFVLRKDPLQLLGMTKPITIIVVGILGALLGYFKARRGGI
ncbi:MAG: multiheme c-type cytochrome [Candidatus Methanofastidiosia archaeon]